MIRRTLQAVTGTAALIMSVSAGIDAQPSAVGRFWPQWRGPMGTGESTTARPPIEWSEQTNVRWKVPLQGEGKSTPVVWGDAVFITSAVPAGASSAPTADADSRRGVPPPDAPYDFVVLSVSRADGKVRWRKVVHTEKPHEGHHADGTFASGSVLTDGKLIFAFFGSRGLYALDANGNVKWTKQLGQMQTRNGFGEASSPALHDGTLIVQWDHEGADFVVALDAATGKEKWRRERDEPTTWTTPHVVQHGGKVQVVVSGSNRVVSYDLATGETLWQTGGLTANVIPSPVSGDGFVYAMSGFRGNMARAIKLSDAKGEVTGAPAQAWTYDKDTPYVPSPLLYKGALYFLKSNSGVLTSLDAKTGAVRYSERLEAVPNVYASPVAADGRIYIVGREGTTVVIDPGAAPKVIATNPLQDAIDASPALVDSEIYLRGARNLYKIAAN
jgi:outer membrane protein assembly factor BamB